MKGRGSAPARKRIAAILSASALSCGSVQYAVSPNQDVLANDATPRRSTEKDSWCPPPEGFPREIMLIVGETCWVEIVATQAQCAEYILEEPGRYMTWDNRCWFFRYKKAKRQPTSSAAEPLSPVTTR